MGTQQFAKETKAVAFLETCGINTLKMTGMWNAKSVYIYQWSALILFWSIKIHIFNILELSEII